jgi:excisionase family DNA binding protein
MVFIGGEMAPTEIKVDFRNGVQSSQPINSQFEPLLDSHQAAHLLGVHPKTLQQMARRGQVPAIRVGKFWRFRGSALDTWIKSGVDSARGCAYRETQEKNS